MRLLFVLVACCGAMLARSATAQQRFPYKAFINANEVYLRSGPGQSYYPTDKLAVGQEVEVYRHDPGGWYAVRPVEGSFSWVAARYLKPGEDNLAVVAEENVAARVGSRFSEIRDVVQVRLHKEEVVELLDAKQAPVVAGSQAWCRITPPAGEFRWVFGKFVDPEYPRDGLRRTGPGEGAALTADATEPAAGGAKHTAGQTKRGTTARRTRHAAEVAAEESAAATAERSMSPEEFQEELESLELELSTMVVEEPTVWAFSSLQQRAELLLNQAETAPERGRARLLLNKVAHFADLKQRYDAVSSLAQETDRTNQQLARLSPPLSTASRDPLADGRFDGVGKLAEVRAPKIGAPRYALLDESGQVRCYVSPAPGVNLHAYVGRQVGITGVRGYMPEQHARHLMARHVSTVDDSSVLR
jgi:SH3-like domain-containing protein